ncbi:tudor domain-containing 6 isoform X1 [Anguilla rostrata]|uniref:tudor domain-containing 6 isoform X1 n=1 Tax=Anguilla rostrata TaxID=7938 RepID=UPI0030CD55EF
MCSVPGLPTPGSDVTILITRVNLNPLCVLVELWGNFDQERKLDYQRMRREIQFPKEMFRESEGNPGDLCLVQVYETWYRARVVSRSGTSYSMFLIDEGRTLSATFSTLAWGQKDFFHLPPEVEFCVVANVLPLSPDNRWSPMALEFLKSLCGRTVNGCVQDVLVPHRTFLLDIPCISKQMYEVGFAKKLSIEKFKLFVSRSLQSLSGAVVVTDSKQMTSVKSEPVEVHKQIEKRQCYMYPELQTETVETVIVTEVTNPLRIFCQLKVFSQELKKLTEQITQHFEGRLRTGGARSQDLGSPCASRGSDGKWYRSVLQQVLPSNNVVEVLHVDYGKKDFVQLENVRPLAAEFLRMPVVTYVCSLHGVIDKGVGWSAAQIGFLKSLILHRTVIAKFEYQSLSEGVHYVTLYGDENVNINNLFGMKEKCLLESEKSCEDYAVRKVVASQKCQDAVENESLRMSPGQCNVTKEIQVVAATESLPLNSSHMAVVQYVESPSDFWIQTQQYALEFDQLMNTISDLYSNSADTEGLVRNPHVGLFCAARSQDNAFYRATVRELIGKQAKVYFVDYGNTEVVDWYNLRVLPKKCQTLPPLALRCSLSGIKPQDGKWSQSAILFFFKATEDKILDVHASAKSQEKYFVQLTDASSSGKKNIGEMLCSAGLAEIDDKNPVPKQVEKPLVVPTVQAASGKCSDVDQMKPGGTPGLLSTIPTVTETRSVFKEHLFPIGSSVDVNVSYIESPSDFWCQISQNAGSLNLLMQDIQKHYADSEFQHPVEAACIARHPDNRMWYRTLIIQKHASPHVDVLFIDYGQTQKVPIQDLRPINPTFLKPKGQAFRCSLYNLIHPAGHSTLEWSDLAILEFQGFVDSAASSHVDLRCTIYAVMYDAQKVVFNVVDLETPFQSVCSLLVKKGLADRAPPKKVPLPPFRLDTYYYSTHNIKTGGEEQVYVTSVKSVNLFFCQLGRNSDLVEELASKVNYVCRQLQCVSCPQTFGTVCFAKYTDGQWYRGQIKSTHPAILVQFVDYGDTLEVDKSDLLPIPIEASEIMSVPVQAVECGLSDIPANVPSDVNGWFANTATDHSFRALVVAKEPCGKLMVELYDGKVQVNSRIKEKFHLEAQGKENVSYEQCDVRAQHLKGPSTRHTEHIRASDDYKSKLAPQKTEAYGRSESLKQVFASDTSSRQKQENVKKSHHVGIQWESLEVKFGKHESLQRHQIPQSLTEHDEGPPIRNTQDEYGGDSCVISNTKEHSLPKLEDLPTKSVKPGLSAEVFVSHCNSPSSFFVQLTDEENEIFSVVEKLNEDPSTLEQVDAHKLQQGDLVNAEFADDCSWYRAVVREKMGNHKVQVEFIDFGNTATVSSSNICRLDRQFLELPRYSIPCLLSGIPSAHKGQWDKEIVAKFRKTVGENAEKKLKCSFIKQTDYAWEVSLVDQNVVLADTLFDSGVAVVSDGFTKRSNKPQSCMFESTLPEKSKNESKIDVTALVYKTPDISEGQTFEVYATSIVGPDYFWCQYAHSDQLHKISDVLGEMASSALQEATWAGDLYPGSPCLALFKEDEQWYRAEVITKTENVCSVLFVDYGNESEVEQNAMMPVPPPLLEALPQAFLCLLEGFDPSQGSWDESAADQFFGLLTDEVLSVTILKVKNTKDRRTPRYQVRVVRNEEVINNRMRDYWKHSVSLDDSRLPTVVEEPSTEATVSCFELHSAGQAVSMDLCPEQNSENASLSRDFPQSFGSQTEQSESLNREEAIEVPEQHLDRPVDSPSVEKTEVEDEDMKLGCTSKLVSGFDKNQECAVLATVGEENNEGNTIPRGGNVVEETSFVTEDASDGARTPSDHGEDSKDTGLTLIGVTDSVSETTCAVTCSIHMPSCPPEVLEESTECVSEGASIAEGSCLMASPSEELPAVCLAMSEQESCESELSTSEPFKDSEEHVAPADSRNTAIEEHACALDETDPLLYKVGESFDELMVLQEDHCAEVQTDSDIYEEVFKQCTGPNLKDMGPVPLFSEGKEMKENVEEYHTSRIDSKFGDPMKAQEQLCVGSECFIWSYAHDSWCRAKIVKISEDNAKVFLLDHDAEAIVDMQNVFQRIPETPAQCLRDPVSDICSSHGEFQLAQDMAHEEEPARGEFSPGSASEEVHYDSATDVECCGLFTDQDGEIDGTSEGGVDTLPVSVTDETVQSETQQAGTPASAEAQFEEQMSHVTHLTLKVEEMSDDEVIFVKEMQVRRQLVRELGANEKEQSEDLD